MRKYSLVSASVIILDLIPGEIRFSTVITPMFMSSENISSVKYDVFTESTAQLNLAWNVLGTSGKGFDPRSETKKGRRL